MPWPKEGRKIAPESIELTDFEQSLFFWPIYTNFWQAHLIWIAPAAVLLSELERLYESFIFDTPSKTNSWITRNLRKTYQKLTSNHIRSKLHSNSNSPCSSITLRARKALRVIWDTSLGAKHLSRCWAPGRAAQIEQLAWREHFSEKSRFSGSMAEHIRP